MSESTQLRLALSHGGRTLLSYAAGVPAAVPVERMAELVAARIGAVIQEGAVEYLATEWPPLQSLPSDQRRQVAEAMVATAATVLAQAKSGPEGAQAPPPAARQPDAEGVKRGDRVITPKGEGDVLEIRGELAIVMLDDAIPDGRGGATFNWQFPVSALTVLPEVRGRLRETW